VTLLVSASQVAGINSCKPLSCPKSSGFLQAEGLSLSLSTVASGEEETPKDILPLVRCVEVVHEQNIYFFLAIVSLCSCILGRENITSISNSSY
jgi:hypothetical protein